MKKWTRARYQPNLPLRDGKYVTCSPEHRALARQAAVEGMVLLKNENEALPLKRGTKAALFGRASFDYVKGGGGSGAVAVKELTTLYDALKQQSDVVELFEPVCDFYRSNVRSQYDEGLFPGMTIEPELPEKLLREANDFTDTAIVCISRFSGEGWDRSDIAYYDGENPWESEYTMPKMVARVYPDGDFGLTRKERKMVAAVKAVFPHIIVVLNIGGVIDTAWIKDDDKVEAALNIWQGGMEGAAAAAEVLCGKANPSGKLADTFARTLEDYPSSPNYHESVHYVDYSEDIYVGYRYFGTIPGKDKNICYPFGFGLSYTKFLIETERVWEEPDQINFQVRVCNIGKRSGKEVVQVYYSAPQGLLQKPARELGAFGKTRELEPGEYQIMILTVEKTTMASFDDLGKVKKSAWVLEKGNYHFAIGNCVEDAKTILYVMEVAEDVIVEQLNSRCAPTSLKERLLADGSYEQLPQSECHDMNACVIEKMVPATEEALSPGTRARSRFMLMHPYKEGARPFDEVAGKKMTLEEFMAQLSDDDLISLLGGQPNLSVADTHGFGNLPEYGVPNIMTADGPAGLRLHEDRGVYTTAWPCATMMACTWNVELAERVGRAGAKEVKENNICVWLTPAVNIHRNPLCGRNFEYYSEDPYLTGKMAVAAVRGIQSEHIAAAVKHFACNNKETNRKNSDSRVSERALREIYLKGFEMIVKEADPWVIMSSYNVINGHRASECKELLEDILRGEWHFGGMVTSDWWTRGEHYKEILAGNDVKMACGFPERVEAAMKLGAIGRKDLEHSARRVLELILKMD